MKSLLQSCGRICLAAALAIPVWLALAALLLILPPGFALGAALFGIVLLMCGKELERKWMVAVGGVLAFAGVLAWALSQ
jgi:hypothetical protein